ncbi:MAG: ABC transporter permease [Methylococcales bacterium]|nr:ABC transporter permease [Methylococcales bacterium]
MDYFSQSFSVALDLIFRFDPTVWRVVWVSLEISIVAVMISSTLVIPLGTLIALNNFPGKQFLQQLLNTLMAVPTVVIGLLLYGLLSRQGVLGNLGLLYTQWAIIAGECLLISPIILNLTVVAIHSSDKRLVPTLLSLGANRWQLMLIVLSETRFAVMTALVTGFGRAIGEMGIAMMLGGNIENHTRTMTTAIALETSKGEFEFGLALGLLLLSIAFLVNMGLQQLQRDTE